MNLWKEILGKIFGRKTARVDRAFRSKTSTTLGFGRVTPKVANEEQQSKQISNILWAVKRPRYAHMAKYHELREEFTEANHNYNLLVQAQSQTLGNTHPDLASALYEQAKLNHHHYHEIKHTPDMRAIPNTIGRGSQVYTYYTTALNIRKIELGENQPAYAQSLYGLASFYKDNQRNIQEALAMLNQAQKIQINGSDPLPTALTTLCLADVIGTRGEVAKAIKLYQDALEFLTLPSASLEMLNVAEKHCNEAKDTMSNHEFAWKLINEARSLQSSLVDPYFEMTFELVGREPQLLLRVLELHRQQYTSEFRTARLNALKLLAGVYRKSGNPQAAIPLLQEASEMQGDEL